MTNSMGFSARESCQQIPTSWPVQAASKPSPAAEHQRLAGGGRPVRLTGSRRGVGTSIGAGPLRVGRLRGRSRVSVRLPGGFRWRGRL